MKHRIINKGGFAFEYDIGNGSKIIQLLVVKMIEAFERSFLYNSNIGNPMKGG